MHFSDTTFSLAKGLHHINNAREYFKDVKRDCHTGIKNQFSNYIQKCDFIIDSIIMNMLMVSKMQLNCIEMKLKKINDKTNR